MSDAWIVFRQAIKDCKPASVDDLEMVRDLKGLERELFNLEKKYASVQERALASAEKTKAA